MTLQLALELKKGKKKEGMRWLADCLVLGIKIK